MTKHGTSSLRIQLLFPCFLFLGMLDEGIQQGTSGRVSFSSSYTLNVAIWHEMQNCFFVHRQRVCTCRNWVRISSRLCCPKRLHIQVAQHIIWSHRSQHLDRMNMITRILTSCSTIVDKQHKLCKDTSVLDQSFGVHHDMYACFVVPVQMYYKIYKRVPLGKSCVDSMYMMHVILLPQRT